MNVQLNVGGWIFLGIFEQINAVSVMKTPNFCPSQHLLIGLMRDNQTQLSPEKYSARPHIRNITYKCSQFVIL